MSTYLELVNKVLAESGSEMDPLDEDTWDSAESGRRIYTRVKAYVADAWKKIQMDRNEWQFEDIEVSTIVYPRIRLVSGSRAAGEPPVGAVFSNTNGSFIFTVRTITTTAGDWADSTAEATIEFEDHTGFQVKPDDTFTEVSPVADDGTFTYLGRGSYSFLEVNPNIREIQWGSVMGVQQNTVPTVVSLRPIKYIPFDNWFYNEFDFVNSALTVPQYCSQDYKGDIVFYPQTFTPFRISFICDTAPQILTELGDEPAKLKAEYHDWIAWEALKLLGMYDKNPDVLAYAGQWADWYARRAERNEMPIPSWGANPFYV